MEIIIIIIIITLGEIRQPQTIDYTNIPTFRETVYYYPLARSLLYV